MPIYEFVCEKCDRKFDVLFRSFAERKQVTCPKCKGDHVRKAFSVFGMSGGSKRESGGNGGGGCASCARGSCRGCHH